MWRRTMEEEDSQRFELETTENKRQGSYSQEVKLVPKQSESSKDLNSGMLELP